LHAVAAAIPGVSVAQATSKVTSAAVHLLFV